MQNFSELKLIAPVQRAIADEGYTTPTPIQAQTIPAALEGRDVLGSAQTGTGKTAAFSLPMLDLLGRNTRRPEPNRPRALVLAPTRELAIQIGECISAYGRHLKLRHALIYGGVGQNPQVQALRRGVDILVATPGRLLDLFGQGHIQLDGLELFVLDEADRMLDMGFLPDLKRIIRELPEERQSLFFSATLPPRILELAASLLQDPVKVNVTPRSSSVEAISQYVLHLEPSQKQAVLRQILRGDGVDRTLVFARTKRGANQLAERLVKSGFRATAIHGNKSQAARQRALDSFRRRSVRVLVATDVAARGIDVEGVTHVVNYDLPDEPEAYVHRIGRTGRAGAVGVALSFCTGKERGNLRDIERQIGQRIAVAQADLEAAANDRAEHDHAPEEDDGPRRGQRNGDYRSRSRRPAEAGGGKPHSRRPARESQSGEQTGSRTGQGGRPARPGKPYGARKPAYAAEAASGEEQPRRYRDGQGSASQATKRFKQRPPRAAQGAAGAKTSRDDRGGQGGEQKRPQRKVRRRPAAPTT
ncbi:MAG: DEAD/DEAH box helicase [Planctomycetaceae bacterium]